MKSEKNMLVVGDLLDQIESGSFLPENISPKIAEVEFNVSEKLHDILGLEASRLKTLDGKPYTLTDVRNFNLQNIKQIEQLFKECYGIDVYSDEGIHKINLVFKEVKNIYKERYFKTLVPSIANKNIKNITDIQDIFKKTTGKTDGTTYCALSKLFRTYITLTSDIRVQNIEQIHNQILTNITGMMGKSEEINDNKVDGVMRLGRKDVDVSLLHRPKDVASFVGKAIGNITYDTIDDYDDLHGFTLEVDSQDEEDFIRIMLQTFGTLSNKIVTDAKGRMKINIENKGLIHMEEDSDGRIYSPTLERMKENKQVPMQFYVLCNQGFIDSYKKNANKKQKKQSAAQYKDAKFEIKYEADLATNKEGKLIGGTYKEGKVISGTEIKIIQKGNNNERGLAFHPIYGYAKLFRESSRLVGYIRHTDIINIVNDFFLKLNNNLEKKSMKKGDLYFDLFNDLQEKGFINPNLEFKKLSLETEKEIKKGLYWYYEKSLIKVRSKKGSKKHFYIHESYKDLVPEIQADLFNEKGISIMD